MTSTMKAVVYHEYGGPEVLQLADVPKPSPAADEILIRVHATSVTTGDVNLRGFTFIPAGMRGLTRLAFGIRKPRQSILGVEFAGEVAEVGADVSEFAVGDAVFGLTGGGFGAYAEYKTMAAHKCVVKKPASLSYEAAASFPNGALTAYTFLKKMANVQPGQRVLVNGASGSVGSAGVQLAVAFGAEVTGVCSTRNIELVQSLGAQHVIDYTQTDFTQNGETYDVIFDTVGKSSFAAAKNALSANGLYLASAGGLREIGQALRTSLFGSAKKVKAGVSSDSKDDLATVTALLENGKIRPIIDQTFSFDEIVEAHRYVDTGRKRGNVVITVT